MLYVYGLVPPLPLTVTLPVLLPLQSTCVLEPADTLNDNDGSVIVTATLFVQPRLSLIPIVYVPADNPPNVAFVAYEPPPILYVYGLVPPLPLTVTLPVLLPLQSTCVLELADTLKAVDGSVTVTIPLFVQLFASVIV